MKVKKPFPSASRLKRLGLVLLQLVFFGSLTGCWTPPNANVQPPGEPRLIQSGIPGELFHDQATVRTVDADKQLLGLKLSDGRWLDCHISPQVKTPRPLQPGDRIKVTLSGKLAVYVLHDGEMPVAGGSNEVVNCFAKVQSVDPSYRLLTLQYSSGETTVLKAALGTKLEEIKPGDSVKLESAEAVEIHIEKP
jgi:hypothetical protein